MQVLLNKFLYQYLRREFSPITIARDVAEAAIHEFNSGEWHEWGLRDTSNKVKDLAATEIGLTDKKTTWAKYEV